jgi:hypothetical protein
MSYGRDSGYGRGRGRSYGGSGTRGFNRGSPAPKPVEVGKYCKSLYPSNTISLSTDFCNIYFIFLVKNGQVKQNVKVKVEQVGNRFATATLVA